MGLSYGSELELYEIMQLIIPHGFAICGGFHMVAMKICKLLRESPHHVTNTAANENVYSMPYCGCICGLVCR